MEKVYMMSYDQDEEDNGMEMPIDHGAIARQVIDDVDVDKLLSNLQGYRDFAAKNGRYNMANDLQNAIMVISAMRYELRRNQNER